MANIVLTAYFTSAPDTNHLRGGITWSEDHDAIRRDLATLKGSVESRGHEYKCITDVNIDGPEFVHVDRVTGANAYWRRWHEYLKYLDTRLDIEYVVGIDATDTEMVTDPFPYMQQDKLYVCSEPCIFGDPIVKSPGSWLRVVGPAFAGWYDRNEDKIVLNAGLISGDITTWRSFIRDMLLFEDMGCSNDMPPFNYLLYSTDWNEKLVTGYPVHTLFNSWTCTPGAWWRHK